VIRKQKKTQEAQLQRRPKQKRGGGARNRQKRTEAEGKIKELEQLPKGGMGGEINKTFQKGAAESGACATKRGRGQKSRTRERSRLTARFALHRLGKRGQGTSFKFRGNLSGSPGRPTSEKTRGGSRRQKRFRPENVQK